MDLSVGMKRGASSRLEVHVRSERLSQVNTIPPKRECLHLLCSADMPRHIQEHSQMVCQVALVIADGLIAAGVKIDRPLVSASALLHDITKLSSFKTGENHAQTGCDFLAARGFVAVGEIVRQHVMLDDYFAAAVPSEVEVVNYADKRVLHDRVVQLDDRMAYILKRYATTRERRKVLAQLWQRTRQLEDRLFSYLNFRPDEMAKQL